MSRIDDARGRIASLLSRAKVDDGELTGVEEAELQQELKARVDATRKRPPPPASENPRSRNAGAATGDATARRAMAERRAAKVHGVRNKRTASRQAAEDEAFRRVKEQARQRPSASSSRSSSRSSSSRAKPGWRERASSGLGNFGRDDKIVGYYKLLELPYDSPHSEVKTSYRKLMRKYHPDRHTKSPKRQKAATELTMKVTQAYNGLEEYLNNKNNKS